MTGDTNHIVMKVYTNNNVTTGDTNNIFMTGDTNHIVIKNLTQIKFL